jgi:hypothetical protein
MSLASSPDAMPRKKRRPSGRRFMNSRLTIALAAAALAFTPLAAWSQTSTTGQGGVTAAERDSPTMQKPGKIQKETDPQKNGTTQSQSTDGMNKNGQPQK